MYPTLHPHRREERETASAKHGRSFSHPFPSFLGRKSDKRAHLKNKNNPDSTDDDDSSINDGRSQHCPHRPSHSYSTSINNEPMTGRCMTCNSTVRWPRDLRVFRCTVCLTVNDLEPYQEARRPPTHMTQQAGHAQFATPTKAVSLSLERTRAIIDRCLQEYLSARQQEAERIAQYPSRSDSGPVSAQGGVLETLGSRNGLGEGMPSVSRLSPKQPSFCNDNIQGLNQVGSLLESPQRDSVVVEPSDLSEQDGGCRPRRSRETIFRPVENYITSCLTGCATLNSSFLSVHPGLQRAVTEGRPVQPSPVKNLATPPEGGNDKILPEVEVDAKTLLLGDIAENGSWWTGERPPRGHSFHLPIRARSPDSWRGVVDFKSPRLNWTEIASWYRCLFNAGDSWREKWSALQRRPPLTPLSVPVGAKRLEESAAEIEEDLFKSRDHLQRVLLKATENLLKRPRRPLKHPEDCRFLFILLANPLLFPDSPSVPRKPGVERRPGPGKHSSIIKRLLGLMAHVPDEVHRFFVSWFSRFSEGQFQRVVDLVGGFVTYRLTRPSQKRELVNPPDGLVPSFAGSGVHHASQLHAALGRGRSTSSKPADSSGRPELANYADDWQMRASARVVALLFAANGGHSSKRRESMPNESRSHSVGLTARHSAHAHGQLIPISSFYNTMLDYADLVADFENWESGRGSFSFCQYPFFLSIYAKIHLLEMEARRQMENKAREAFFDSILSNKAVSQYLVLKVRRDCLVDDSLRRISEVVGSGQGDIKKGLRIDFIGEEGVDAGGLRKEWFLLLIREVFDEAHGLFVYDEDSRFCYFNPHCFESSEQYFLVGVVTGLAIYNSTILDIAFPPFVFKKLLASTPVTGNHATAVARSTFGYSLEDLAELHPALAHGLRQLLEYDGDVQETFCRDFVVEEDRYGEHVQVPLIPGGEKQPVTNSNRREYVQAYIHYLLDTSVSRQYEPFKRGFFTVCGGNALSLFRPEEIELLIRGSDEPLDIKSLQAVAVYEGWPVDQSRPPQQECQVQWFWEAFETAKPADQRKLLAFITGSDRIPAMGATNLVIKIQLLDNSRGPGSGGGGGALQQQVLDRFPTARTCFNTLVLHPYRSKEHLERKLWTAVRESEGFGLK